MAGLVRCRIPKLIRQGFSLMSRRHVPTSTTYKRCTMTRRARDIAWRLGIDGDIEDGATRCVEVKNWIEKLVIPSRG